MNDDIVARLRKNGEGCTCFAPSAYSCGCDAVWGENYISEAADEIERRLDLALSLAVGDLSTNEHWAKFDHHELIDHFLEVVDHFLKEAPRG